MRLIRMSEAARMLGVDAQTLRRRSMGRDFVEIYGKQLRVYRMDIRPNAERRFDADEIGRLLARVQKAR
ncbi:MAG: hypothetical protein K0R39_3355 [Symbiobacteriaceae bacterium]|jgi:hypothetical protein|nr:hypothetical protein [Symbiobacteriaceae bacterium]